MPDGDLVEYCLRPSPLRKLVRNLPPLVDSRVPAPDGPGLGIELDEDVVGDSAKRVSVNLPDGAAVRQGRTKGGESAAIKKGRRI